jgi:hypothetical protein
LCRIIEEIEQKVAAGETERAKLDRFIELRGKQFYAFLSAAQELRQLLKEEEEDKEKAEQEKSYKLQEKLQEKEKEKESEGQDSEMGSSNVEEGEGEEGLMDTS